MSILSEEEWEDLVTDLTIDLKRCAFVLLHQGIPPNSTSIEWYYSRIMAKAKTSQDLLRVSCARRLRRQPPPDPSRRYISWVNITVDQVSDLSWNAEKGCSVWHHARFII